MNANKLKCVSQLHRHLDHGNAVGGSRSLDAVLNVLCFTHRLHSSNDFTMGCCRCNAHAIKFPAVPVTHEMPPERDREKLYLFHLETI